MAAKLFSHFMLSSSGQSFNMNCGAKEPKICTKNIFFRIEISSCARWAAKWSCRIAESLAANVFSLSTIYTRSRTIYLSSRKPL